MFQDLFMLYGGLKMKHIINLFKTLYFFIINFFGIFSNKTEENNDKTYSVVIGSGAIMTKTLIPKFGNKFVEESLESNEITNVEEKPNDDIKIIRQSFQRAVISFRWTTHRGWKGYGGEVVITRQPNTTEKTYNEAKEIGSLMKKELNSFGRFIGDKTTFIKWVGKWKLELEKRGYHDVKKD